MLISPPRFKFSSPEAIGAMDGHAKLLLYLLNSKWQSTANALWCFTLHCLCLYYSFRHKYAGDFNSRDAFVPLVAHAAVSELLSAFGGLRLCASTWSNFWNTSPFENLRRTLTVNELDWLLPVYYLGLHVQMTSWWSIPFAWFVCSCSAA